MAEETERETTDDTHRLLARMLSRQRTADQRARVDAVLTSGAPAAEQVAMIETIDAEAHAPEGAAPSGGSRGTRRPPLSTRRPAPVEGAARLESDPVTTSATMIGVDALVPATRDRRRDIVRHRVALRNALGRVRLWEFLIRHRRRILEFHRRTGLLDLRPWALRVRLHRDAISSITRTIESDYEPLREALEPVLEDGWRVLTKPEYNLVRLLWTICDGMVTRGVSPELVADPFPVKQFATVERDLLALAVEDPDGTRCTAAIDRLYRWRSDLSGSDLGRARGAIATLLDFGRSPIGLGSFILALNMAAYGRYVGLEDLRAERAGDLVDTEQYDCSETTTSEIERFIAELIMQIPPRVARRADLAPIDLYTPRAEDGRPDRELLASWCGFKPEERNNLSIAAAVAQAARTSVSALLDGQIEMSGGYHAAVFDGACFSELIGRLARVSESLTKLSYTLPTFAADRLDAVRRRTASTTTLEREAGSLIDELSSILVAIGRLCTRFAANRCTTPGCAEPSTMPFSPTVFQRPFLAVETDQLIAGPALFAGISILDAVARTAQLCFLAGDLFGDASLAADRAADRTVSNELRSLLSTIQRVAHRAVYEGVVTRWPGLADVGVARSSEGST